MKLSAGIAIYCSGDTISFGGVEEWKIFWRGYEFYLAGWYLAGGFDGADLGLCEFIQMSDYKRYFKCDD